MIVFGEIGLSGEIRAVPQMELRLKEASKLGFERALCPTLRMVKKKTTEPNIHLQEVGNLHTVVNFFVKEK